jgi:hypothetical protein
LQKVKTQNLIFGGVAVLLAVSAWYGVGQFLEARDREDARIAAINEARSLGTFIAEDEARFGTAFRDSVKRCTGEVTQVALPKPVTENYEAVYKAAITLASDENFAPKVPAKWFAIATRSAAKDLPLPDTVFAGLAGDAKTQVEEAMAAIERGASDIGACLTGVVQHGS